MELIRFGRFQRVQDELFGYFAVHACEYVAAVLVIRLIVGFVIGKVVGVRFGRASGCFRGRRCAAARLAPPPSAPLVPFRFPLFAAVVFLLQAK